MPEPNFFLVGAPKAGSTSLYYHLRQHPEIYMSPIKEPCYFSSEARPENFVPSLRARGRRIVEETRAYLQGPMETPLSGGIVDNWDDYLRLFAAANGQRAIGEASVGYMTSPHAARGIAERCPHAKILMVLRSPIDRAFSQYLHVLSGGFITSSFRGYVRACLRHSGEGLGIHEPFLEMGFYAAQVQRYLDHFPRGQIAVWIYEEHLARPQELLRQIFRFLEVDEEFQPDTSRRYHQPPIPRLTTSAPALHWARDTNLARILPAAVRDALHNALYRPPGDTKMGPADRALMLDFYSADIRKLEGVLGRDLSAWLV